jgi:hypothetical protein
MMARINAAQAMKIQGLSSAPTAESGRVYYDTGTNTMKYYDGSSWITM